MVFIEEYPLLHLLKEEIPNILSNRALLNPGIICKIVSSGCLSYFDTLYPCIC